MLFSLKNVPKGESLKTYAVDLTELAKEQKMDPVIGREEEVRRTLQVNSRSTTCDKSMLCICLLSAIPFPNNVTNASEFHSDRF